MDPLTMSMIIGGATQGFKIVDGIVQKKKGQRMLDNNERPVYETPDEINQSLAIAELNASRIGIDGQDMIEGQLDSNLGNLGRQAKDVSGSSAEALAAITGAYGQRSVQQMGLGVEGAQMADKRRERLKAALGLKAEYTDREFEINDMQPYLDTANAGSALVGAGMTNVGSGIAGMGRVASQGIMAKAMMGNGGEIDPNVSIDGSLPKSAADYAGDYVPILPPQPVNSNNFGFGTGRKSINNPLGFSMDTPGISMPHVAMSPGQTMPSISGGYPSAEIQSGYDAGTNEMKQLMELLKMFN